MIWWSLSQLLSLFADRRPSRLRKLNDALLASSSSSSSSAVFCFVPNLSSQSIVCREQLVSGEMYIYAGCLTKLHGGAYASPCYDSPTIQPGSRYLVEIKKTKKKEVRRQCNSAVLLLLCAACVCVFSFFFIIIFPVSFIHTLCCVCVYRGCASFGQDRKGRQRETLVAFSCFSFPPVFLFYFISFQKGGELGEVAAAVLAHQRFCILVAVSFLNVCMLVGVCVCVGRVCVYMWRERESLSMVLLYRLCPVYQCAAALDHLSKRSPHRKSIWMWHILSFFFWGHSSRSFGSREIDLIGQ